MSTITRTKLNKCIYSLEPTITTDGINVRIQVGLEDNPFWEMWEEYNVSHNEFETWLDDNNRLEFDDTEHFANYAGEDEERGGPYSVPYTDYIQAPWLYPHRQDLYDFLVTKKRLSPYKIIEL